MNQRLVESVARIVLAMSEDERRLLERKLQQFGLRRLDEPAAADKSLRIAEIAQDIQEFEEQHYSPLSDLPADQWMTAASDAMPFSTPHSQAQPHPQQKVQHEASARTAAGAAAQSTVRPVSYNSASKVSPTRYTTVAPTTQIDVSGEISEEAQSYFQLTHLSQLGIADNDVAVDYALYESPIHSS